MEVCSREQSPNLAKTAVTDTEEELSSLSFSDSESETLMSDEEWRPLLLLPHPTPDDHMVRNAVHQPKVVGDYMLGDELGQGSYSKVKDAIYMPTLARRAVKIVSLRALRNIPFGEQSVRREEQMLRALRHPHVLRLLEVRRDLKPGKVLLVLEYCATGLQDMLDEAPDNKLTARQAHAYLRQLLSAVDYLQSRRVVHKDIKPANLLLALDGSLRLADFGVAEALPLFAQDDTCRHSEGSPAFQPPEVANWQPQFSGFKLDVWSCGVTLYCFVVGRHPFSQDCENVYQMTNRIAHYEVDFPTNLEPSLRELLKGMMARRPSKRWSVERIRKHPWLVGGPQTDPALPPASRGDPMHSSTAMKGRAPDQGARGDTAEHQQPQATTNKAEQAVSGHQHHVKACCLA